ncbi:hypothetical protein ACFS7Z_04870 [Pontibacter toksunensis]|uniref:Uncharacterized protein n=1 Tax=Pontibacter toksunensis TaxID=1332631 RepID=A0ABW6BQX3_9BACT
MLITEKQALRGPAFLFYMARPGITLFLLHPLNGVSYKALIRDNHSPS